MIATLYRYLIYPLLTLVLHVVAPFNRKLRRGLSGRKKWRELLGGGVGSRGGEFRVHFHAASVGEFEQAKPLIDALRGERGDYRITATFFSPSGFEQQRKYSGLDAATFLPPDRPGQMRELLELIDPDLIVIIRYDLWLEFLLEALRRNVPAVLVCGVLNDRSPRFLPVVRPMFSRLYGLLSMVCAVGSDDAEAFALLAPDLPVVVTGDTRFDRVLATARSTADLHGFTPERIKGRSVLVAGSTWPPDEELLDVLSPLENLLLVIVPHEPTPEHVRSLLIRYPGSVSLSRLEESAMAIPRTVIVDRTGILSALYRIGDIAYVGGGFGAGVHSVLEPAAYGLPVLCGPHIKRSPDAMSMRTAELLHIVTEGEELIREVQQMLLNYERRQHWSLELKEFIEGQAGATERILGALRERSYLPTAS